jgi:opacity protein-like surface antigen
MRKELAGLAGALLLTGSAFAADDDVVVVDDRATASPTVDIVERPMRRETPLFRINALAGGAHYANRSGDRNDLTLNGVDPGPAYGVLVGLQPLSWLGVEGQYQGASNRIDRSEIASGADRIVANGVSGHLRVQAPLRAVEPFLFGGVGYMRLDENGTGGTGDRSDNLLSVPVGAGIDSHIGRGVNLGARFTYDILQTTVLPEIGNSDLWMATINIGAAL